MKRWPEPLAVLTTAWAAGWAGPAPATETSSSEETVELAVVNGTPITTSDLDALLIRSHRDMDESQRATFEFRRLLDKLINDRLLIQQARQLGLDEEPSVLEPVEKRRAENAVARYVKARYAGPEEISDAAVREYFDEYYWKIRLRQLSVLSEESARELRAAVLDGASMDSLARAVSVDTYRYRGGLHNLKVWADVEDELRNAVAALEVGQVSEIFPYREAHAFVRVEDRRDVDLADLPAYESEIRKYLGGAEREKSWKRFVDGHQERFPVRIEDVVVARIRADSARMISREFVVDSEVPAVVVGDDLATEYDLRKSLSHQAMQAAQAPFDSLLDATIEAVRADLLLRAAARAEGWFDDESVERTYREDLDQALIQAYLAETIVPSIRFNRQEFREYWEDHPEEFREAPQVQLGTIMVGTKEEAEEIVARLQEGADFDYLRAQYARPGHDVAETDKWVSPAIFADDIRAELVNLDVGQSTRAHEVAGGGWFVFKLKNRREGRVKPLEECELRLREIMFQKKFNALLDEHLALLKERSDLVLHEAAIREYFGSES